MGKKSANAVPILTRAESEIMALFWRHGPLTVAQVHQSLSGKAYTSLATLVKILEQKGYLTHAVPPEGRGFVFTAAVAPKNARRQHVKDLIDRLFGGKSEELVAGLLSEEKFTRAELEAMRAEIDARLSKGKRE